MTKQYNEKRLQSFIGWDEILEFMNKRYAMVSEQVVATFTYWGVDNIFYIMNQVKDKDELIKYLNFIRSYTLKYKKLINSNDILSEKYKIKIIYNTKINNLNFYKENHSLLDISQKDIEEIEAKLKKINKKETYNVLTNYPSLKEFVNQYEININLVDEKTNDTIVVNEAKPFDALIKFIRSAYAFK